MRLGVTGADGFLGWHLKCRLFADGIEFAEANRDTFGSPTSVARFVDQCDVILHAAGVARARSDDEVARGNLSAASTLIDACEKADRPPAIVFANSIKSHHGGSYGDSKAEAAAMLETYARRNGVAFADVVFPNLFGVFGRPFHNSAVSTFAHQLATGQPSKLSDGQVELLEVQNGAQIMVRAALAETNEQLQPGGRTVGVADVYGRMRKLSGYCDNGVVPDLGNDPLDLPLFNTIRSHMWPDAYPMELVRHADHRGAFFEVVRAWGQGQTSISTTVPGLTRGGHFHFDKMERFAVVSGEATIRVRRLFTDRVHSFDVSGTSPVFVDMPPQCTHDITNTGPGELVTLFWSHDHFDPNKADTIVAPVEPGEDRP